MKWKIFSIALHAFFSGMNASFMVINMMSGKSWYLSTFATVFCGWCAYDSARRVYEAKK